MVTCIQKISEVFHAREVVQMETYRMHILSSSPLRVCRSPSAKYAPSSPLHTPPTRQHLQARAPRAGASPSPRPRSPPAQRLSRTPGPLFRVPSRSPPWRERSAGCGRVHHADVAYWKPSAVHSARSLASRDRFLWALGVSAWPFSRLNHDIRATDAIATKPAAQRAAISKYAVMRYSMVMKAAMTAT